VRGPLDGDAVAVERVDGGIDAFAGQIDFLA